MRQSTVTVSDSDHQEGLRPWAGLLFSDPGRVDSLSGDNPLTL